MYLLPYSLFEKCAYILALEMATPGNQLTFIPYIG